MPITLTVEGEAYLFKIGDEFAGLADVEADCIVGPTGVLLDVENPRILLRRRGQDLKRPVAAPPEMADMICAQLVDDDWFNDRVYEEFMAWREDTPARIGDARYDEARA